MTKERISLGKQGEEQAAIYLKEAGCTIIAQNYTCPWGEIDLIAQDGSYLVFVEVRVRSSQRYGSPLESVNAQKQAKVRKVAQYYLQMHGKHKGPIRFDVAGFTRSGKEFSLVYIRNAF